MEKFIDELIKEYEQKKENYSISNLHYTGLGMATLCKGFTRDLEKVKSSLLKPVEVPEEIIEWFIDTLGSKEKFDGNDVFRIIQDILKVSDGFDTWNDYNINGEIVKYAEENEENFLKLLVNCSKNNGYTVIKEPLYWAVMGVTDYFRCDGKIIVFAKEEEAVEVANLIGINTEVKKMDNVDISECISIDELKDENREPLYYVKVGKLAFMGWQDSFIAKMGTMDSSGCHTELIRFSSK